ncbi:deoxynucleoside triphosphate triphosphohydrolase SAMHD1-like [Notolabrus celidotus]|uniref:deoxynucleoside triphosphate triphosphohydrolase SAMHD1-like n=1 Tax=Notolabrus celidotus TaxID=1203425 RepID=UPI00148FC73B|nr:deoxynucleoside triphosphate triphosphohydrolase SAMHD1-like [Notolabrus celidotus]
MALISDWKKELAKHLPGGKPEDFEVLVARMDYGMNDEDPVEKFPFYSKFNLNVAKFITGDQATRMGTTRFSEELVRVYYKKADDMRGYLTAKESLAMWWKQFLDSQE